MRKLKIVSCPFGAVLVAAREERGVTQYQLARLIGRTTQQLAKLEHGLNEPRLSTVLRIAQALDMEPCELMRETFRRMKFPG